MGKLCAYSKIKKSYGGLSVKSGPEVAYFGLFLDLLWSLTDQKKAGATNFVGFLGHLGACKKMSQKFFEFGILVG